MSKISVRFLIDKEHNRVLFAEAGSDFVDVLFSFLTLPLGRIVRLLDKQSGFGSLDSLYKGVEQLEEKYLQTEACKELLLNPRSGASFLCEDLMIENIHTADPWSIFTCNENDCLIQSTCYYSYANKSRCSRCGKQLTNSWKWPEQTYYIEGTFVEDTINFMIMDDLRVLPTSLMRGYSLIEKLRIKDARYVEEKVIDFGTEEVLNLLRRSLVSKIPLTEVCLGEVNVQASENCSLLIKEEMKKNEAADSEITLKLILDKKKNNVLCAEVGEDFINQLLSFLTFPLGSVLKLLSDNVSVLGGCISNLYSSVENMGSECFKSEDRRNILLTPKLATFYGIEKQIMNLEEISSDKIIVSGGCPKCYKDNGYKSLAGPCKHARSTAIRNHRAGS